MTRVEHRVDTQVKIAIVTPYITLKVYFAYTASVINVL